MKTLTLNPAIVSDLQATLKGRVISPEDPEYDAARIVRYGSTERRPLAVIRVANADDISRAVSFARDNGLELAVRSGGHSGAGHGTSDGGIVIDLSDMKALEIDVEGRTAWAETGLTAGQLTKAVGAHGLAVGFGDTGSVGIGGITLGGGVGYLVRKYGLTIDSLLAAEVVTADGEVRYVDAENHPDLFWAIRGGGGNFGVATRFKYRLQEVGTVVGGMLLLPATPEIIASFMAEAEAAPEELSAIVNIMPTPPMPFVPAEHHGKLAIMALMCYAGPVEEGERVFAPFRALATPFADMVRPIPYPEMYPPDEEGFNASSVARTLFLESVDRSVAQLIVDRIQSSSAMMAVTQLRVLGGAVARVPAEATAYAHRTRRIMGNVAALYMNPEETPVHEAWVTEFAAALRQGEPGAYVNFVGNEGEERVHHAYPGATWDRLAAVKAKYDPTNLFRLNQNIKPAS